MFFYFLAFFFNSPFFAFRGSLLRFPVSPTYCLTLTPENLTTLAAASTAHGLRSATGLSWVVRELTDSSPIRAPSKQTALLARDSVGKTPAFVAAVLVSVPASRQNSLIERNLNQRCASLYLFAQSSR